MPNNNAKIDLENMPSEIRNQFHEQHIEKIRKIFMEAKDGDADCGLICYRKDGFESGDCTGNPVYLIQVCTNMLTMLLNQLQSETNRKEITRDIISYLESLENDTGAEDNE